ncbi:DNA-3-methyladenine glycosylase 2 family protein [Bacteriovorax sp. BSW11_IV]|uniref:DNA-3-methyladenine glycosylase 2 family protein n=1 Tax=Bacteriovorax sp. BSW11_IV TaxID=1353529 RepID=UPI000695EF2E|nr:Ada metal-binding domain-containing protein [Bacteriovorax sp. BSW11_IV]
MLELSDKELKQIIARRDPRYDGRFYFGVKTTKIYCRPVCPARPKPENIIIFRSHSEAEGHHYRPCKRCRPDMYPGQKSFDEKYALVSKALDYIESGEDTSLEELSDLLHISSRHLRRLFTEYLGATPIHVLNSRRLHLAKKFLLETNRPITEIAFAVGFNSLRRFNEAFKDLYQINPSTMRKEDKSFSRNDNDLKFELHVRRPYDWDYVIHYLDKHLSFGVEVVKDGTYSRYLLNEEGELGLIAVSFDSKREVILLEMTNLALTDVKIQLPRIKRLLDVDHNPSFIPTNKMKERSLRVVSHFDSYEIAVSIILGQLVSTKQAKKKFEELVRAFGNKVENNLNNDEVILFPYPDVLMNAEIEKIGVTKVKTHAIRDLSKKIVEKEIELSYLKDIEQTKKKLLEIKGIGKWSAELMAMRCLGDVNAFADTDLFIKRAIDRKLVNQREWDGVRSYLCHHIWRDLGERLSK